MILRPRGKANSLIAALALLIVLAIVFQTLNVGLANAQYTPQQPQVLGTPSSSASSPARLNPQCYNPYLYRYDYSFGIRGHPSSDKKSYLPGETVTISGYVGLLATEVWNDGCGNLYYGSSNWGDPSGATVTLDPTGQSVTVGFNGLFSFSYTLPVGTPPGPLTFHINADDDGYGSDSATVTISVQVPPLTITLSADQTSGAAPFTPTLTFDVEGGVAPYTVTIDYGDSSTPYVANGVSAGPGQFVPSHTYAPGTYLIKATGTDQQGRSASDARPIQATAHLTATINCPTSVYTGDQVSLSATVSASDRGNPQISYRWSALAGAGSSSPVGGTFDDSGSPTPKWTAPFVNAQMDYTIYVRVSATGYDSDVATCKLTVSPQPNYGPIVAIGTAITAIAAGCGGYIIRKNRKKKKDDPCRGFSITCSDPLFIFGKKSPEFGSPGWPYMHSGEFFTFPIDINWPGSKIWRVELAVSGAKDLFNVDFGSNIVHVTERVKKHLVGGRPHGERDLNDYWLTVTATGYTPSGKVCRPQPIPVLVHFCDDDVCSHGPFFPPTPDVHGHVERTDGGGNTEQMTGSSRPFQPGDKVQTFTDGFFDQGVSDFLGKGLGGGRVVEAARSAGPAGSGVAMGPNSQLGWLDPKWLDLAAGLAVPWLRLPEVEQLKEIAKAGIKGFEKADKGVENTLVAGGKMLLNWQEKGTNASILLPKDPAEAANWVARVKGTRLLIEAARDGSATAITILEDYGKTSTVEVFKTDAPHRTIKVHGGEQVLLRAGKANLPVKVAVDPRIGIDPFGVLRKWWSLQPATVESLAALKPEVTTQTAGVECPVCRRVIQPNLKFCTYCGTKLATPEENQVSEPEPPRQDTVVCPSCGRIVQPDKKFCIYCGTKIGPPKKQLPEKRGKDGAENCAKCGEPIRAGKKFCIKCGTPVGRS